MNFSKKIKTFLVPFFVLMSINTFAQNYQPNWESLDKRHTPQWYAQAKFGIFLHWGIIRFLPGQPILMPMVLAVIMQNGTGSVCLHPI